MITAYHKDTLQSHIIKAGDAFLLQDAIWVDVVSPTKSEEALLENSLTLNIPTREEMSEIELSSRLYKSKDVLFMTAPMIAQSTSTTPKQDVVTFVLSKQQLITIRYIDPQAFKLFIAQLPHLEFDHKNATSLLIELLEATMDRLADILEVIGHHLEESSQMIFRPTQSLQDSEKPDYHQVIQHIGINADLNSKARECLIGFSRLTIYFSQSAGAQMDNEGQLRLGILSKDISALSDHANFISSKVNFLLDATLGMINNEQNTIIKIFSVAAVIFLPPTLIASIYGMNFHYIPELSFKWGYLVALGMMIISALLPYKYFKWKRWL